MRQFHVNPETGEVSRCKALFKCPFESEHFPTEALARGAYEEAIQSFQYTRTKDYPVLSASEVLALSKNFLDSDFEKSRNDEKSFEDGRHSAFQRLLLSPELDANHYRALNTYCSENHSKIINKYLRENSDLPPEYRPHIKHLSEFLRTQEKDTSGDIKYTGISLPSRLAKQVLQKELEQLSPGAPVKLSGYTSTSISFIRALEFAGNKEKIILEIDSDEGVFVNESVEEVLFPSGTTFRFLSFRAIDDLHEYLSIRLTTRNLGDES